jgi:hypothetical protein
MTLHFVCCGHNLFVTAPAESTSDQPATINTADLSWTKETTVTHEQSRELRRLFQAWLDLKQPENAFAAHLTSVALEILPDRRADDLSSLLRTKVGPADLADFDLYDCRTRVLEIWTTMGRECQPSLAALVEFLKEEVLIRFIDERIELRAQKEAQDEVASAAKLEDWTARRQRYVTNEDAHNQHHAQHLKDHQARVHAEEQQQRRTMSSDERDHRQGHHQRHHRHAQEQHRQHQQRHHQAHQSASGWRSVVDEVIDTRALEDQIKTKFRETVDQAKPWIDAAKIKAESMHKQLSDKLFGDHSKHTKAHDKFVRRATKQHRQDHQRHHEQQRAWHRNNEL